MMTKNIRFRQFSHIHASRSQRLNQNQNYPEQLEIIHTYSSYANSWRNNCVIIRYIITLDYIGTLECVIFNGLAVRLQRIAFNDT